MQFACKTLVVLLLAVMSVGALSQDVLPDKDGVYAIADGVTAARLVHAVPAVVPGELSALRRVTALVVVVGADGNPTTIQVANRESSPLDKAAIAAVRESQFVAGSLEGKAVATRLMVWVPFLGGEEPAIPVAGMPRTVRNLTLPRPLFTPEAEFSKEARKKRISGSLVIEMVVNEEGKTTNVHAVTPLGAGLDQEAVKSTSQYVFKPATLDGVPVPWLMDVEISFRLR
jgi:TonB family protein